MGQKHLAVLTGDSINESFVLQENVCRRVLPGSQKRGCKVAFHCIYNGQLSLPFFVLLPFRFCNFLARPAASLACSNSIRGDEKIANDVELPSNYLRYLTFSPFIIRDLSVWIIHGQKIIAVAMLTKKRGNSPDNHSYRTSSGDTKFGPEKKFT